MEQNRDKLSDIYLCLRVISCQCGCREKGPLRVQMVFVPVVTALVLTECNLKYLTTPYMTTGIIKYVNMSNTKRHVIGQRFSHRSTMRFCTISLPK